MKICFRVVLESCLGRGATKADCPCREIIWLSFLLRKSRSERGQKPPKRVLFRWRTGEFMNCEVLAKYSQVSDEAPWPALIDSQSPVFKGRNSLASPSQICTRTRTCTDSHSLRLPSKTVHKCRIWQAMSLPTKQQLRFKSLKGLACHLAG